MELDYSDLMSEEPSFHRRLPIKILAQENKLVLLPELPLVSGSLLPALSFAAPVPSQEPLPVSGLVLPFYFLFANLFLIPGGNIRSTA